MKLRIISTQGIKFEGEVTKVTLPGTLGSFTVLDNHASLLSTLTKGVIVYDVNKQEESIEIEGGFVDINNNQVSVCLS